MVLPCMYNTSHGPGGGGLLLSLHFQLELNSSRDKITSDPVSPVMCSH